ncbi:DEKNAAC103336 [Brettanomyces naardenensis]|uniref:DEKNAAC103336 n=1 Tax=Brettanomyces naardenensis TaxID=13370 RepID=A0A448YNP2_BRENA|nr:DEKNAAC103336 [Brettanomyces naardenensis]
MAISSKRTLSSSDVSAAQSDRPSKLAKLSKTVGSLWGIGNFLKRFEDVGSKAPPSPQDQTGPIPASIKTPINARQLAELYERVKAENSVLQQSSLQNESSASNVIRPVASGENELLTADGSVNAAASTADYGNSFFDGVSSSTPRVSRGSQPLVRVIERPSRSSFGIDPIERAQLVHLKKRMEADRYRRTRLGYLRRHTQNLVHSRSAFPSGASKYVDTAVNTVESRPTLVLPTTSGDSKRKIEAIPENKRNKDGYFVLDLAYDETPEEKEKTSQVALHTKPLSEKLKFGNDSKKSEFNIGQKAKSYVPEEKKVSQKKKELTKDHDISIEESTLKPSVAFTFSKKEAKEIPKQPLKVPSSNLKANATLKTGPPGLDAGNASALSPAPKSLFDTAPKAKPAVSFGSTTSNKPAFSFGSKAASTEKKPAFSFGAKQAAPAFSLSSSGASASSGFSLTAKSGEQKKPASPAFSFNAKLETPQKPEESKKALPAFSFNPKTEIPQKSKDVKESPTHPTTAFAPPPFVLTPSAKVQEKPKEKVTQPVQAVQPTGVPENPKQAAPAFKFGSKSALPTQPSSFSSQQKLPDGSVPFRFGASQPSKVQVEPPSQPSSKPVSQLASHSLTKTPSSGFSLALPTKPAEKPSQPAFNLSSQPAAPQPAASQPAFNFGSKVLQSTAKPAFNFGSTAQPGTGKRTPNFQESDITDGTPATDGQPTKKARSASSAPPVFKQDASKITSVASGTSNPSPAFGSAPSTGFSFGNGATGKPPAFGGSTAAPVFGSGTSSTFCGVAKPQSVTNLAQSAFGNANRASSVPPAFGNGTNANGFSFNSSKPSGLGSNVSTFGGFSNSGNTSSGLGNHDNQNSTSQNKIFNFNSTEFPTLPPPSFQQQPAQPAAGFSFGGNNASGFNANNGFNPNVSGSSPNSFGGNTAAPTPTFNFNSSATPDINFAGNNAGKDPAAIFSGPPVQPTAHHQRRRMAPRPLRRH